MNKMSGDLTQQVLVSASAFPVLRLKSPVKIVDLSTFAEDTLGMMVSHKALHKVTRALELIPIHTRPLLKMFLNLSSVGAVAEEAVFLAGSKIPGNFAGPGCAGFS